jgi:hypothetical protein
MGKRFKMLVAIVAVAVIAEKATMEPITAMVITTDMVRRS